MKSLITALITTIFIISAQAQTVTIAPDSTGMYTYREVIETGLGAEQNYNRVKNYIAINYRSANDVIQFDIKEQIIAKGIFTVSHTMVTHYIHHTLVIDIKDNKIRITYRDFRVTVKDQDNRFEDKGHWLSFPNKDKTIKKASEKLSEIMKDLRSNITTPVKDDW